MKRNYLILFLTLFILVSSRAFAVDPPHSPEIDQFKTDKCLRCHGSQYPFPGLVNFVGSSIDNTATNLLCRGCHDDGIAVNAVVHSSLTTTEEKGIWSAGCTSCHDPHYQYQYKTWGSESFLSSGTVASIVGNTITVNGVNWTPNMWSGYIVVPNTRYGYTYKITGNTSNTLTVKGPILTRYAAVGSNLGIFYGRLIKSSVGIGKNINGTYTKSVKFFNSTGPYSVQTSSTNNNDKAICVVCHTKTQYMNIERIYNGTSVAHNQTDTNSCYTNEAGCHKQHKQGFQRAAVVACGDCHGNPPISNTPGGGGVVYKTKVGGVLVDNTTGPLANNVSGGAHQRHAISRGYGCETCHYGGMWAPNPAANPQEPDNLKITMGFYLAGDTNGYYLGRRASNPNQTLWNGFSYNGTAATAGDNTYRCSNLYCHSNANPLGGTMTYKLPTWNGTPYTGGVCNQCHSASSETTRTWSVKHDKHVVIYNANTLYNCNACHSTVASNNNTVSGQGYHVNRTKDVVFNGVNPNALAYNSAAYQCSNLYCHSNANPLGGTMSYKYPKWNDAAYGTVCNECHTNPAGDSGWSAAHSKHAGVSAGKYAYTCDECHAEVVANNSNTTIINYSKHVNASKDIKFSTTLRSTTLNQSGGGYTATYTCTATYCHSQGTSKTAPFTAPVTTASWDGSTPSDCSGCHQSKANLSTGSHGKHLAGGNYNYNCVRCHSSVMGTPANDIAINTPSLHVDAINQVAWDSYNSGGSNYNTAGAGTCSNIYCHSQGTKGTAPYGAATVTATWGNATFPSSECSGCHGGNAQASGAKMSTGAHTSHINNASVLGTNFKCGDCHATTVSGDRTIAYISNHVDKNINIAFTGQNAVGSTYNGQATPRALPSGHGEAKVCSNLYCHSDGKNTYSSISWTGSAIGCNGCHGLGEVYGRPNYANTGPGTTNANSHLSSTHSKTECNACHYDTVANFVNSPIKSGSTLHINKTIDVVFNTTIGGTWSGGSSKTCTDVSCHSGVWYWGGAAVGCTGCHEASAALAGLHNKHYNTTTPSADFGGDLRSTSTQYIYGCGNCHPSNQHSENDGLADVSFDLSTWSPSPYNGGTYQYGISTATDSKGKQYTQDGTCSNVYCHSSGLTYTGTPTYKTVHWNDPAVNCDSCHNAGRTTLTTNKHAKHIAGTSGNYNYACKDCHSSVLSTDTSIGDKSLHVNRTKDVVWNATLGGGSNYQASGTGQCSNIYCHSTGTSGSAPFQTLNVAQWNGTGFPTDCTGCHKGYVGSSSAIDTYAHTSHINNASYVGWKVACSECHNATVAVGNSPITGIGNHVEKLVNIKFDNSKNLNSDNPYYNGVISTGSTGAVKSPGAVASTGCSNVYCHSSGNIKDGVANVQFRTVKWDDPAMGCNGCHGTTNARGYSDFTNTGAGLANANSHYKHADAAASNIGCVACHSDTTVDGSTVNTVSGLHINRAENVVFNSIGGKTGTYNADKSCSNTYCHGTLSAKWGAPSLTCDDCHSGNKNLAPSHALHWNSTTLANSTDISLANNISTTTANIFTCANCHPSTHANGPAGTNRAAEVAFNITWAGTGNTTGSYTQGAANAVDSRGFDWRTGGSCANLYCHSNAKPVTGSGGFARSNIYANAIWNGGSLSCSSCHDAPSTGSSTWSAAHDKHVDASGGAYSFTCNNCHANTANNNTQIGNYALHVNARKDITFNTLAAYNGYVPTYVPSTNRCSNTYCHSAGFSIANQSAVASNPNYAVWNSPLPTDCTGCHGGAGGAYPQNANGNPKWNSHDVAEHKAGTCADCHQAVVGIGNTIINPALHVNNAYNISNSTYIGGYTFRTMAQGKSTCVSVSCHGGNNADWGATLTCENCHGTTGPDVNSNYAGTFWSDGSMSLINTNEWTTTGHGRTSGNYSSGNPAANKTCTNCHSSGVAHKTSTNPFRLAYTAASNATWGWNWNCTVCHATGQSGATKKVDSRHYGSKHTSSRSGGQFCWDCHDPHGDSNVYMVGANVASVSNATYGWPTAQNATVFTAYSTGTDYAKSSAPYNGVCQVCHTQTAHYTASSGDGHNSGTRCTSCHAHTKAGDTSAAFAAAGESSGGQACGSCHSNLYGRMHNNIANMVYKHYLNNDNATYLVNASVSNTVSHKLSGTSDTNRNCLICHADHDIFRPDINTGVGNRGGNLRASVKVQPQKGAANASTWSMSDFNGDREDGGICLSCHRAKQAKALTTNNGVNNVPPIPFATSVAQNDVAPWNSNGIVKNSTHNYSVQSGIFSDNSRFQAVCLKCHNDTISPNKGLDVTGQQAEPKFGLHQSSKNGFFAVMGTGNFKDFNIGNVVSATSTTVTVDFDLTKDYAGFAVVIINSNNVPERAIITATNTSTETLTVASWPSYTPQANNKVEIVRNITPIEEICFNCHSTTANGYKPYANKDFYNTVAMSNRLEGMFNLFIGDSGTHTGGASKTTITDSTKSWTSGQWVNYYCVMKSGANAGRKSKITANTATTLTVSFPSNVNTGDRYEIVKPASHPLDKFGLHNADEQLSAGIGWNLGDQGSENVQTVSVSNTTFRDSTKGWLTNVFVGNYVWLGQANGTFIKKQITANTVNTVSWSGAVTIDPGMSYLIGPDTTDARHVSCADCHNTHAAQVNPSGTIASGATTTSIKDTSKTTAWTGWANNKWAGYLFMYTDSGGVRRIRPISASTTDATGTTYTLAIPLPAAPAAGASYEVLLTDGKTGSGGKGVWGVGISNLTTPPTPGSLISNSAVIYTKNYDTGGDATVSGNQFSTTGMQYMQCLRCHSYYSYKNSPPTTPSGNANGSPKSETDIAAEFNPNNYAHHAVFARGKNQPIVTAEAAGKASSATTSSITIETSNTPTANMWAGYSITITNGTGIGQTRIISSNTTAGVINVVPNWTTTPNNTSWYVIGPNWTVKGVATGGSTTTVVDTKYKWTTGQYNTNWYLVMRTGSNAGQARQITGTAVSTITTSAFSSANAAGNEYVIVRNGNTTFGPSSHSPSVVNLNWPRQTNLTATVTTAGVVTFNGNIVNTVQPGWHLWIGSTAFVNGAAGWYEVTKVLSQTSVEVTPKPATAITTAQPTILTAGLGNTFVPPYGPWSILRCTDCHGSTLTDPLGPHASVNNWLIKDAETNLKFEWWNGTSVVTITYGTDTGAVGKEHFCFNCHRADVYTASNTPGGVPDANTALRENLSRVMHDTRIFSGCNRFDSNRTKWPQYCRHCHGGDKLGGIHGSNAINTAPNGAAAGVTKMQAKRLLNGSSWGPRSSGLKRSTTSAAGACYVVSGTDDVTNCGQGHTGDKTQGGVAMYDYDNP